MHDQWANSSIAEEPEEARQWEMAPLYMLGFPTYSGTLVQLAGYVHANFSG